MWYVCFFLRVFLNNNFGCCLLLLYTHDLMHNFILSIVPTGGFQSGVDLSIQFMLFDRLRSYVQLC